MLRWFKNKITKTVTQQQPPIKGLGIALSGGSARGFAHIGVLKALSENGLEPEIISGTSMGALVGVLYAAGLHPEKIQELVNKEPIIRMVRPAWGKNGLFELKELRKLLEQEIHTNDFSALKKPFYLAVSNINEGKKEIINNGTLFEYVIASCAVPIIFTPQKINNITYIDGGLYDNLPSDAIRNKCSTLIGVNVNPFKEKDDFESIKEIAERTFMLSIGQNVSKAIELCDYLIEPPEMKHYTFWDFDKADEIIKIGYNFTRAKIKSGEIPLNKLKT